MRDRLELEYIWVNDFNDQSLEHFHEHFNRLESLHYLTIIPIFISSYGGEVYSMIAMRDLIKTSTKKVATIAVGKAMSSGAFLLAAGSQGLRYASPNSTILIHEISTGFEGKNSALLEKAIGMDALNKQVFGMFSKDTNTTHGYWIEELKKRGDGDIKLSATQAKKLGIIDHIGVPRIAEQPGYKGLSLFTPDKDGK